MGSTGILTSTMFRWLRRCRSDLDFQDQVHGRGALPSVALDGHAVRELSAGPDLDGHAAGVAPHRRPHRLGQHVARPASRIGTRPTAAARCPALPSTTLARSERRAGRWAIISFGISPRRSARRGSLARYGMHGPASSSDGNGTGAHRWPRRVRNCGPRPALKTGPAGVIICCNEPAGPPRARATARAPSVPRSIGPRLIFGNRGPRLLTARRPVLFARGGGRLTGFSGLLS